MAEEDIKDSNVKSTIEAVTGLVKAVPVYEDAVQPAAKQIGKSLETITKAVNIALVPLRGLVWGYERIEEWLKMRVAQKLENIPQENVITPPLQIAGPTIEALRYTGEDSEIRELYANLIATSMNSELVHKAHPGYVDIIRNMTSDEAILLKCFVSSDIYPFIDVKKKLDDGYIICYSTFTIFHRPYNISRIDLIPLYIDNLIRLGLLERTDTLLLTQPNTYEPLVEDEYLSDLKCQITLSEREIGYNKGIIRLNSFGKEFVNHIVNSL
ncbi:hypothetical protein FHW88_002782 [Mucilaginibacter sp. SG538B]|uniref:DUF4393 domain-containing protein n=1 Tax=Mucilaginibacter sp. SG538B TaxID=2587021 RepID=UPI00159E4F3D|nr:DUF4393 domain-containing protein [Mucilaginibacter sp. SG538B]NVM64493.1 hypothetical protein [Mucilaginibacter sp. SG538B]